MSPNADRGAYGASSTKRLRRTKAEIAALKVQLLELAQQMQPMTVRGLFYQAEVIGLVPKDNNGYKTVCRLTKDMRLDGTMPFSWIVDNTRWMRKPTTFVDAEDALLHTARTYRRDLWATADRYVEVWCEKDALAGVLYDITANYDVPLMVNRGFSSITYLHTAAMTYKAENKPVIVHYFGDADSYGIQAEAAIERRLREFAPEVDIEFSRAAVTEEQVEEWDLPTRFDKKDPGRLAVELDAVPAPKLRDLVESCITDNLDPHHLDLVRTVEDSERELFLRIIEREFAT